MTLFEAFTFAGYQGTEFRLAIVVSVKSLRLRTDYIYIDFDSASVKPSKFALGNRPRRETLGKIGDRGGSNGSLEVSRMIQ